jgi:hypothetical protein
MPPDPQRRVSDEKGCPARAMPQQPTRRRLARWLRLQSEVLEDLLSRRTLESRSDGLQFAPKLPFTNDCSWPKRHPPRAEEKTFTDRDTVPGRLLPRLASNRSAPTRIARIAPQ